MNPAEGPGNGLRLARAPHVFQIGCRRGLDFSPIRKNVSEPNAIHAQGICAIVLNYDEHRKHAVAPGVQLSESFFGLLVRDRLIGRDCDFFAGLLVRILGRCFSLEGRLLVARTGKLPLYSRTEAPAPLTI